MNVPFRCVASSHLQFVNSICSQSWPMTGMLPFATLYAILMPKKLFNQVIANTYIYGVVVSLAQIVATFLLSFCGSNRVNHFYCDDVPLAALAYSDTHVKELMLLTIAGFNTLCSLLMVIISHIFILFAILRIRSSEGSQEAFLFVFLISPSSPYFMQQSFLCTSCPFQAIL